MVEKHGFVQTQYISPVICKSEKWTYDNWTWDGRYWSRRVVVITYGYTDQPDTFPSCFISGTWYGCGQEWASECSAPCSDFCFFFAVGKKFHYSTHDKLQSFWVVWIKHDTKLKTKPCQKPNKSWLLAVVANSWLIPIWSRWVLTVFTVWILLSPERSNFAYLIRQGSSEPSTSISLISRLIAAQSVHGFGWCRMKIWQCLSSPCHSFRVELCIQVIWWWKTPRAS